MDVAGAVGSRADDRHMGSACDVAGSPADGAPRNVRSEMLRYEQCAANLGLCNVIRRGERSQRPEANP
jgi:hypothetical protein